MKYIRKNWFAILSFCVLFIFIYLSFQSVQKSTENNRQDSLDKTLKRGILECYALEGHYPKSLDYLVENYHIIYNKDEFDIQYEIFASNIMTNVTIIKKN